MAEGITLQEMDAEATTLIKTGLFAVATNNGNNYAVKVSDQVTQLEAGLTIRFKVAADSTGAPTLNINALGPHPVLKANGNPTSFKLGGVYTVVWDGENFITQGEGGEYGTATTAHVLAPYTIGTEDGIMPGTMVDRSGANIQASFSEDVTIAKGYRDGTGKVLRPVPMGGDVVIEKFTNGIPGAGGLTINYSSYTKIYSFLINVAGTYRIRIYGGASSYSNSGYARVYKNGVAIGPERYIGYSGNSYVQDFTVDAGDTLELWGRYNSGNGFLLWEYSILINIPQYVTAQ
ncbi:hypothetical protein [uncultured Paenibacillus sp.]|uniref:hypothetical protein n=1 Tax=uncultured Paenibacillus sp. TaxID=227322 RepID=UPI0015AB0BB1|nr:hypothetical protein [uncultured Paenibacillus sp.]DAI82658.1 MAG TPA: hypothetical protein [Caudoviricetes sp.]